MFLDFLGGSAAKESTCNVGNLGSIPGLGRSPGEGKGYSPQYSGLENSMDCIKRVDLIKVACSRGSMNISCYDSINPCHQKVQPKEVKILHNPMPGKDSL